MYKELIYLPSEIRPILTIVIHTEEEFDWEGGFYRSKVGVSHIKRIHAVQEIFEHFSITPTYVVDYPIASQKEAFETIKKFVETGRAEVGAHLHPWVSPPFKEKVNSYNSYPGNLSHEIEYEKTALLTDRISEAFGVSPKSYLAGRYGFGPNTASILLELGYQVDISAAPPIDFSDDGGPDYSSFSSHPFWLDDQRRLLGIPGSGAYVGLLQKGGHRLYQLAIHRNLRWSHLPGIMSRLRLFERLRLSPEGYSQRDMRRLTMALFKQGVRHFVFSFHSPSVMPGCTPYVQNEYELASFLDNCRQYIDFFRTELEGVGMTPLEFKRYLASNISPTKSIRAS